MENLTHKPQYFLCNFIYEIDYLRLDINYFKIKIKLILFFIILAYLIIFKKEKKLIKAKNKYKNKKQSLLLLTSMILIILIFIESILLINYQDYSKVFYSNKN